MDGQDQPVQKKKKHLGTIVSLFIIAGLLIWIAWPSIMQQEEEMVMELVYPAIIVLDSFEYYISDGYVDVTFELKNTGDADAMDVSCFIRCCDQNGTILLAPLFTFGDIWPDTPPGKISASSDYHVPIPATASYRVPISNETIYITHSIDIRWSPQGVNTYMQLTNVWVVGVAGRR